MKFRMVREQYTTEHSIDGVTAPVTKTRTARVPVLPRDVDAILTKGALGMALLLTAASIAWSTYAIGSLLGATVGYIAAGVFDAAWLTCLALEYLARYDKDRRTLPRNLGWMLLAGTMAAIGVHGYQTGGIPVAIVGAAVSAFAKVLWHAVLRQLSPELSDEDRQWLSVQSSKAHTKAAVATVQRTAARIEGRAALELLAIERDRMQVAEAFGLPLESTYHQVDSVTREEIPVSQSEVPREVHAQVTADVIEEVEEDYDPPLTTLSRAAAIRVVLDRHPLAAGPEVVEILSRHGVEVTTRDVSNVRYRLRKRNAIEVAATEETDTAGAEVVQLRKAGGE